MPHFLLRLFSFHSLEAGLEEHEHLSRHVCMLSIPRISRTQDKINELLEIMVYAAAAVIVLEEELGRQNKIREQRAKVEPFVTKLNKGNENE